MARNDAAAALAAELNAQGGAYHRLRLADGVVVEGEYDMDRFVHHYRLPADLRGRSALDVGTSSGYFAFELERRGAQVTAIDLFDGQFIERVKAVTGSRVRYVQKSVYDLEPGFGQFDLVVCGSLLLHLPDMLGALRAIRSVCRGQAWCALPFWITPTWRAPPSASSQG